MRISDWSSDVCSSDLLISLVLKVCWGRNVRACRSARLAGAAGGGNAALEQRPFEYARKHAYVGCVTVSDSVQRVTDTVYVIVILAMIAGFLALRIYSEFGCESCREGMCQ